MGWWPGILNKYLSFVSPVPVQFDWDKIRTEMKPIKMARAKAKLAQKKSPKKKIRSNRRYFGLKIAILMIFFFFWGGGGVYFF